jgi:acyl-CoA reductase-like NAD-dependent aldehyde dehydrogenase
MDYMLTLNFKANKMERIEILKTYKIFIGGQFPRTESGRYYPLMNKKGQNIANVCLSSRKDFRNAVVAARSAFAGWSSRSAMNRGQILYRIAEMMEGRKNQLIDELVLMGNTKKNATEEVETAIDRTVYYAGWCDKYQALFGTINPVASSHFNFSVPEAMGVIAIIAPENPSLLGLISLIIPAIAGGNSVIALASESQPLSSVTLAEIINTSDLPGGVINILTGNSKELHSHFASHMDVNAIVYARQDEKEIKSIQELSSLNVKRSFIKSENWFNESTQNPYAIMDLQEIKTTWHPIEQIGGAKSGY